MTDATIALNCPEPTLRANAQGIARVAVDDSTAQLIVTFERAIALPQQAYLLLARSYSLTGGERLFPHILKAELYNPAGTPPDLQDHRVRLQLDGEGDFSIYTLTVSGPDIDPFFSSHKLRFRLECEDPFDCREPPPVQPPTPELPVVIDYLAKDYASFRQALLDFIPTRLPAWAERSEADIGMMLMELFAATADTLSYMQDRVANEAFLDSATQRRSVAGHLALLGYQIDQGASAYTWLQFQVNSVFTLGGSPGLRVSNKPNRADEPIIVFETSGAVTLRPEHNQMTVYSWDHQKCCLPRESLRVALIGSFEQLEIGDYILFDDGQGHRDIVCLTARPEILPPNPIKAHPTEHLTTLRWSPVTPLHYDYCADDVIVRGNLALATHGETVTDETLRLLTAEQKATLDAEIAARKPGQRIPRQRLRLAQGPLAYLDASTLELAAPPKQSTAAPTAPADFTARPVNSVSTLVVKVDGERWQEQPTLLNSWGDEKVFRVEIDDQGEATVVFGDNTFGLRPDETSTVEATYRLGGGSVGNLGADTLTLPRPRPAENIAWLASGPNPPPVTNPLPAVGGRDLESREHARRFGPATFQKPLVAVTAADYEAIAQGFTDANGQQPIQRASADFRWTGSWLTVTLAVDPRDAEALTPDLRSALLAFLDTRRLAGYDLEVKRALYVSVDLSIEFCLVDGFRAGDVQQALTQALSNGDLPGGRKGFFHPDNFSFGDNLYISQLYAAIMAVPGVEPAQIVRLAKLWSARPEQETTTNLRQGYLAVGPDQIIRLDNDRNLPQNGTLTIRPKGGG